MPRAVKPRPALNFTGIHSEYSRIFSVNFCESTSMRAWLCLRSARSSKSTRSPLPYSIYLAKLFGPYATLGLAEDTWALNEEVLDDHAFLAHCHSNHDNRQRMPFGALENTRKGVSASPCDPPDRAPHMLRRFLEHEHAC